MPQSLVSGNLSDLPAWLEDGWSAGGGDYGSEAFNHCKGEQAERLPCLLLSLAPRLMLHRCRKEEFSASQRQSRNAQDWAFIPTFNLVSRAQPYGPAHRRPRWPLLLLMLLALSILIDH